VVWIDRQFGTKWRSENKEKVFYSVRKTIIDRVEDRLRGGESLDMYRPQAPSRYNGGPK